VSEAARRNVEREVAEFNDLALQQYGNGTNETARLPNDVIDHLQGAAYGRGTPICVGSRVG